MMAKSERFSLQNDAYFFPYHYLPRITSNGKIVIYQFLGWGLRYLTYMTYIRDRILATRPKSVCDVGCGDGRLLHMLREIPRRVGVDISARAISFAKAFDPDAEWHCCPVQDVPGTYEVVTCVETLEHIEDEKVADFVSSLQARLSEGGTLVLSVPTVNRRVRPKHYRHYSADLLQKHLAPHFVIYETAWLFSVGTWTSVLGRLLTNRIFIMQHGATLRLIWELHRKRGYYATSSNAAHLVAFAGSPNQRTKDSIRAL
jgi:SAM-dependent methyltransferase